MKRKFKAKILTNVLLLLLLPITLLSITLAVITVNNGISKAESINTMQVEVLKSIIDTKVQEQSSLFTIIANQTYIKNYDEVNIDKELQTIIAISDENTNISISDSQGNYIYSTDKKQRSIKDKVSFLAASNGDLAFSDVFTANLGRPCISYMIPIYENSRNISGVITVDYDMTLLGDYLDDNITVSDAQMLLVDSYGKLICKYNYDYKLMTKVTENMAVEKIIDKKDGNIVYTDYDGEEKLASYQYIESMRMGIIVQTNRVDVLATSYFTIAIIGLAIVLLLLVGLYLSLRFSNYIIIPIEELIKNISKISGDVDYEYREITEYEILDRDDEFGTLANGYNHMIKQIEDRERETNEARERAEEANASQSRFVANMSHEIRTPLNAILGYSEIMKEYSEDDKFKGYINSINVAGNTLLSIVDDILDFSKVRANKFVVSYTSANIIDFCEEIKVLFVQRMEQKRLDFDIVCDVDLPTLKLPITTIRQIIINILGNAVKFTNEGSIIFKLKAREILDGTYTLEFSVVDTGIGIAEEKLDMIFSEFEQADESHQKTGTGLGLAISNSFAQMIGGEINVVSELGSGSTFTLRVPSIELASTAIAAMSDDNEVVSYTFKNQKVLIVDDIKDNRDIIRAQCINMNLDAKVCESGAEALAALKWYKADMILTDLRMPNMSGEILAKNIRAFDDMARIPIICVTASISPDERYTLTDFDDILNKPILSHALAKCIAKYLDHHMENSPGSKEIPKVSESNELFGNISLSDDNYNLIHNKFYEDAYKLSRGLNPKKLTELINQMMITGKDIGNVEFIKALDTMEEYCKIYDIENMVNSIKSFVEYFEKKEDK